MATSASMNEKCVNLKSLSSKLDSVTKRDLTDSLHNDKGINYRTSMQRKKKGGERCRILARLESRFAAAIFPRRANCVVERERVRVSSTHSWHWPFEDSFSSGKQLRPPIIIKQSA